MFNLPFPTDSLYKFAFMFGLVLIVYSFYYKNTNLNKYDKKQVYQTIDSLKVVNHNTMVAVYWDTSRMEKDLNQLNSKVAHNTISKDDILKKVNTWKTCKYIKSDAGILNYFNYNLIDTVNMSIKDLIKLAIDLKKKISYSGSLIIKATQEDVDTHEMELSQDTFSFYMLLGLGFVLFIVGTIFWYIKIQLPQDKLLKMQIEQSNHSHAEFLDLKKTQIENKTN